MIICAMILIVNVAMTISPIEGLKFLTVSPGDRYTYTIKRRVGAYLCYVVKPAR